MMWNQLHTFKIHNLIHFVTCVCTRSQHHSRWQTYPIELYEIRLIGSLLYLARKSSINAIISSSCKRAVAQHMRGNAVDYGNMDVVIAFAGDNGVNPFVLPFQRTHRAIMKVAFAAFQNGGSKFFFPVL